MNSETGNHSDLTKGPIIARILRVTVPIVSMQLMQMLYNLMDIFWLGRLSSGAVAASSTAGMFLWMAFGLMLLGRVGAEIGVSQSIGRGERDVAEDYCRNALYAGGFFGVLFSLSLFLFRHPLIGFFGLKEAGVAADARSYLAIVSTGLPFDFLINVLVGTYNASGNSRTPFLAISAGIVFNLIFDPVLIFVAGMGIQGAAWSTAAGQVLTAAILLVSMKRGNGRPFESFAFFRKKPDFARIGQLLRWSVPAALESMFFTGMAMIATRFIAGFGATAVTVGKVGAQFESLSWLVGGGFASALTAFMGQNFGAGKWTRIRAGYKLAQRIMLCWGLLITGLLFFCSKYFFALFLPGYHEEIALGITYGRILAVCQLPQCFESISNSVFKGTGNTVSPLIVSGTCNLLRVILAFFLSRTPLGLHGIWIAITAGAIARGAWAFAWCLLMLSKKPKADVALSLE